MHDELVVLSYPGPDRSVRLDQLRIGKAMPRRYRNRRIGEFLKELEFTEGRSTGIPKIIHAMKENGSSPPEFEFDEDHTYFMVRLPVHPAALEAAESRPESRPESAVEWRLRPEWRAEWGPESVHDRIMVAISRGALGRTEIAEALGHRSISGAAKQALADLMKDGLVEYTIPDKPNSRLQKYRTFQGKLARKLK